MNTSNSMEAGTMGMLKIIEIGKDERIQPATIPWKTPKMIEMAAYGCGKLGSELLTLLQVFLYQLLLLNAYSSKTSTRGRRTRKVKSSALFARTPKNVLIYWLKAGTCSSWLATYSGKTVACSTISSCFTSIMTVSPTVKEKEDHTWPTTKPTNKGKSNVIVA